MFGQLTSLPKCNTLHLFCLNCILKHIIQICIYWECSPNYNISTEKQVFSADMASTLPAGLGPDVVYWQLFFQLWRGFLGQSAACCNMDLSYCFSFSILKEKVTEENRTPKLDNTLCSLFDACAIWYSSTSTAVAYILKKKCVCKYPQTIMQPRTETCFLLADSSLPPCCSALCLCAL